MTTCHALHVNNIHGTNATTIDKAKTIKCLVECIMLDTATSLTPIGAKNITAATL